jgi:hypothetical protein
METKSSDLRSISVTNSNNEKENISIRTTKDRNEYSLTNNLWIRNFTRDDTRPVDINDLYSENEIQLCIENEIKNSKLIVPNIATENFDIHTIVIISNGFGFRDNHKKLIESISTYEGKQIFCVNNTVLLWNAKKYPNFFLTNSFNRPSGMNFYPRLLCSQRMDYDFLKNYRNNKFVYSPTQNYKFSSPNSLDETCFIDEYRNPICASINCAYKFNATRIFLAFCSEGYENEKDGMINVEENLFMYPQQKVANDVINNMIFWYRYSNPNVKIFHTGVKNSFSFAKYLRLDDFIEAVNYER